MDANFERNWTRRPGLPQRRASLIAASFASVPELQKNDCPFQLVRTLSASASSACGSECQVLGTWISVPTCLRTASTMRGAQAAPRGGSPAGVR